MGGIDIMQSLESLHAEVPQEVKTADEIHADGPQAAYGAQDTRIIIKGDLAFQVVDQSLCIR